MRRNQLSTFGIAIRFAIVTVAPAVFSCAGDGGASWERLPSPDMMEGYLRPNALFTTGRPIRAIATTEGAVFTAPGFDSEIEIRRFDHGGILLKPEPLSSGIPSIRALAAGDGQIWSCSARGDALFGQLPGGAARRYALPADGAPIRIIAIAWEEVGKRVWAIDRLGHRVLSWNAEKPDTPPRVLGGRGRIEGLFNHPRDIATLPDGSVAVLDALNLRVERFDGEGVFLESWPPLTAPPLERPLLIAADRNGSVWVLDDGEGVLRRIDKYAPNDDHLSPKAPPGATDMTFDRSGRLWIVSTLASRIYRYDLSSRISE